ncbi:MAG: AsmA family protein, partial [Candidatus Omnitrophica bacterium]|nr:AsmA family protein [Candidatus Omnitrophota bacterium]
MKKIFLIFFILLFLLAAALTVFLMTFNIDKYKPMIISKTEEATGKGVAIDDIDLSFKDGLGISFLGLSIYPDQLKKGSPSLSVKSGTMLIDIFALLKRKAIVNKLIFTSPAIKVVRDANNDVSVGSFDIKPSTENTPESQAITAGSSQPQSPMLFSVALLEINNGTVSIEDNTVSPPLSFSINDIDINIQDISLVDPIKFSVKAGVFGTLQNIISKGVLIISPDGTAKLENSVLNIDLSKINMKDVFNTFPSLKNSNLSTDITGKFDLNVFSLPLAPEKMKDADAKLDLSSGKLLFNNMPTAFSDIKMTADLKNDSLSVSNASLNFAEGAINASGTVENLSGNQFSALKVDLKKLSLNALVPPTKSNSTYLSGYISADIKSTSQGFNWPLMANTINASGNLSLRDGLINNMNILKEIFSQMSMIPGLEDNLKSRLSDEYKQHLTQKDTVLYPIDVAAKIENGSLRCDNINIKTDHLTIQGTIAVGLVDQALGGKLTVLISPELSNA